MLVCVRIRVGMRLYMSPHTTAYVRILTKGNLQSGRTGLERLERPRDGGLYISRYRQAAYVADFISVLILLYMYYYMCPHTTICVLRYRQAAYAADKRWQVGVRECSRG